MSGNVALFACSKCFTKHPFEELSSGQQLCKITNMEHSNDEVKRQKRIFFSREDDVELLGMVVSENPFVNFEKWKWIAEVMKVRRSKRFTRKNVKERTRLLIAIFRAKGYKKPQIASVKEENYDELDQLLQEASNLKKESEDNNQLKKGAKMKIDQLGTDATKDATQPLMDEEQYSEEDCRGSFPFVKCTYCRSEFQQTNKVSTSTICTKCEHNVKQFGKPSACEYCNIIAAFIGNKCQRCTHSERKYGPPVTCEQCKQKCAFDRKDDDKKVDGKLLCWLCTLSYKRALAKTKQGDADRRAQLKLAAQRSSKTREQRLRGHNKRPNRVDVTKVDVRHESNDGGVNAPPAAKLARAGNHRPPDLIDPNSSDHVVAMTQLKEQMASLQKQMAVKEAILLSKDKTITELKATHFTNENELRNKMMNDKKEADVKIDHLTMRCKTLQKELATLKKSNKKGSKKDRFSLNASAGAGTDGEGGGTGSGGGAGSGGSGTDSPLP